MSVLDVLVHAAGDRIHDLYPSPEVPALGSMDILVVIFISGAFALRLRAPTISILHLAMLSYFALSNVF